MEFIIGVVAGAALRHYFPKIKEWFINADTDSDPKV